MATQQQKPAPFGARSFFDQNQGALQPNPDQNQPQNVQPNTALPAANDSSSAPQMASTSAASSMPSMTPPATAPAGPASGPMSRDQFFSQNPDASSAFMPARPVGELDDVHGLRKALALAFGGLASFGAGLHGTSDPTLGRWTQQNQAERQYDVSKPQLQAEAENKAYGNYQGEQERAAQTHLTSTQADALDPNNANNLQALQRKQSFMAQLQQDAESGKYDPQSLKAKYLRMAQYNRVPASPDEIDSVIQNTKPLGSKYQISQDKNGRPEFATDRQGNRIFPDANGKFNVSDPDLQSQWDSINSAHHASLDEEMQREQRKADYAANAQGRALEHADEASDTRHSREETDKGRAAAAKHLQTMREAQNQNELVQQLSQSKSPTDQTSLAFKALGLDLPDGVHRINDAELHAIQNQGSLPDRAYKAILNWTTGQTFAPEILGDIRQTAQRIANSKVKTANDNLEDVNRLYGYKAPGADERGRFDAGSAQGAAQQQSVGAAAKAQHKVGDVVSVRGKNYKITAMHQDGTFDADPVK